MKLKSVFLVAVLGLATVLAGCTTGMMMADYGARKDAGYQLPAIPIQKLDRKYRRQMVDYETEQKPGTIIVDTGNKFLYLVQEDGKALRYGIGVGRDGFRWSGTHRVTRKAEWPTWTPPSSMIRRQPELARWAGGMPPGTNNPLGARALYIGSTIYRIHGSPEWNSIGRNVSSGCIRLMNQDIIDLYNRAEVGAKVVVR